MNKNKKINKAILSTIETLKKAEKKFNKEGKEIKDRPLVYAISIITQSNYNIIAHAGRLWIYSNGVYLSIDSKDKTINFVKKCISKIDDMEFIESKFILKVLDELFMQYYELHPYTDKDITYINMLSNVLSIDKDGTIKTVAHNKKYNFMYQLPYDYDKDIASPVFDKFLKTSLGDPELANVMGEYLGYILNTNSRKHEKSLFLYGDGSNGKSTFINIIKALYGVENISVVELTDMGDMQKCSLMDGKLLNISSDAKKNGLDTSAFKKIVSGEPILGKYLFKDIYTIEQLPKTIVAMNKLPYHNGDNSFGFYRRLLLVPFNITINEEDKDYELESKVLTNELPAILNFAIEGMRRLTLQGSFTEAKVMKEAMNSYKESSNYVATFIEEEQYEVVEQSTKTGTSLANLYNDFKQWCNALGHNPYTSTYLSSELNHLGFTAYKSSSKYYRIIKRKLENETGFTPIQNSKSPYDKE
ncbi:MAG: hypothetical protein DRG78_06570 [Epsilonproteobacteria bacterium]|nr:MAG: hypothetical protein DRG78_06570 [Campylobacterota bacterium]